MENQHCHGLLKCIFISTFSLLLIACGQTGPLYAPDSNQAKRANKLKLQKKQFYQQQSSGTST